MTAEARRTSNLNVPNALTTLRILLVPVFGWALLQDGGDSVTWRWVAFALFAVAMITDKIDGDLARKYDIVTDFGKIADPIADKAITGMAFIGLSLVGDVWWWVTAVVLVREWSVTLLRLSVLSDVVMAASQSGKVKTMLQGLALGLLLWPLPHGEAHGGAFDAWGTPGELLFLLGQVVLAGAVAMTLWSGWEFVRDVRRHRSARASEAGTRSL
ncbi:CDP-diacylglycerol--glycerol-3-phosphate 3-phosphatidyltransferase [Nocardioides solisilvae]|uniref:CDP-diacylglycerol--glycerol-3-phosphate 3-phosphatidyltransferase n=1 Tax=Nocardioides solisilvae TaxID=1542435 RepID=UPI000D746EF6|nr:CDP-diacylglycerol--glycerol-3-phosphate 3-phosphatidyltransferase [Nocardioides solisilvae]